jgi:autotransporter-associated beta strand protein
VPGKLSMTNDDYRSLTWGMVDPIVKTASTSPTSSSYLKGFSKGFPSGWVNPDPAHLVADATADINFVEFYWADFLRNRIVWNNQLPGCGLDATDPACSGRKNLIAAPISFFAAVANGIALARSESYFDQFGRTLSDYLATDFSANTRTWASASIQNGLASGKSSFHMYLLDDSSVKGDIAPSSLDTVTNSLHIDTTVGQVIAGSIRNFASIDINRGATIETKWKETPALMRFLGTNPETALVIPAGTGAVTFAGMNTYPGTTTVAAGKLIVSSKGAISSKSKLEVLSGAMLFNDGRISVGSYDQQGNAALSMALNERGEVGPLIVAGTANLNGTLNLRNGSKKWIRGRTYKLLTAGSIKGVFTDVTADLNLNPRLRYGKKAVTMTLEAKKSKRSTSLSNQIGAKQATELNAAI